MSKTFILVVSLNNSKKHCLLIQLNKKILLRVNKIKQIIFHLPFNEINISKFYST